MSWQLSRSVHTPPVGSKSYISGNGSGVLEFIMFIAFCSLRKKEEIHFVDLPDMVLCHAEKQSVYKTRAKFRFRRQEFSAVRE